MKRIKVLIILTFIILISLTFQKFDKVYITSSSPTLSIGSKSQDVGNMQQRLKNWGYFSGEISGSFGLDTFNAVKDFQKKHSLEITGEADYNTLMAMGLTKIVQNGAAYAEGNGMGEEQLLARAINGEARGEPYEGQVAVGAVILNRVRAPEFPNSLAGVIYQPGAFTAVSDGQINVPLENGSTVIKAARDALNGWDPTGGCIYYWNPATATSKWIWSRTIVKIIGKHNFGK